MRRTYIHRISSKSLQQRTGVFELEYYLASRTFLWAGHVARMPKSRLPKRPMLPWVWAPRTRTNTSPYDTKAHAAGRRGRAWCISG